MLVLASYWAWVCEDGRSISIRVLVYQVDSLELNREKSHQRQEDAELIARVEYDQFWCCLIAQMAVIVHRNRAGRGLKLFSNLDILQLQFLC